MTVSPPDPSTPASILDGPLLDGPLRAIAGDVVRWRRHLHQHPELSFEEHRTAAYLDGVLRTLPGIEVTRPTPTSVMGVLRGGRPGPTVAVRADIDALPIHEATGLPFASQTPGVMHACGHDGHAAVVLGVATVLAGLREELPGEIRFLFQHGEEQMPKGAPEMIAAGVIDGADVIIGQHLWSPIPVGKIGVNPGALMAASDAFTITFRGRGGHAGLPHEAIEVIPAVADLVGSVQRLVAREFGPDEPVVASITQLHAGEVYNVIPESAAVGGTIRALSPASRARLAQRLAELARDVAALHRVTAEVEIQEGPPVVVSDPRVVDVMAEIAAGVAGVAEVAVIPPIMGGDDYAFFLEAIPGAYVFVGAGPREGTAYPHHHPRFDIDEDALAIATGLLTRSAWALAHGAGDLAR